MTDFSHRKLLDFRRNETVENKNLVSPTMTVAIKTGFVVTVLTTHSRGGAND